MGWFSRKKKDADRTELWRSRSMHLRVAAPVGEGWQRMEAGGDGMLAALKCVRGSPPEAISLEAMVLGAEGQEPPTVDELAARDWDAHLGAMMASVDSLRTWQSEHQARPGHTEPAFELEATGTLREPSMPMRLRERHVPVSGQLLVIKVVAAPGLYEEHQTLVDTWIAHAMLPG